MAEHRACPFLKMGGRVFCANLNMRYFIGYIILIVFYSSVSAQELADTVESIPAIVTSDRYPHRVADHILNSEDNSQLRLASAFSTEEILRQNSPVWIRSNGNSALSTLSIRGSSSQQSIVSWNGIQLNSPSLGLLDISIVPLFLMDQIAIKNVGASEQHNPIGGQMMLQNDIKKDEFQTGVRIGQFSDQQLFFRTKKVLDPWRVSLSGFYRYAGQDFPYLKVHRSALLPDRQPHAKHINYGLMGSVERDIKMHTLGVRSWWQNTSRQLPPKITQRRSTATQKDSIQRVQLFWKTQTASYQQETHYYFARESNAFRDSLQSIDDLNLFYQHQLNSKQTYNINQRMSASTGGQLMMQNISSAHIEPNVWLNRWAIFPSFKFISLDGLWWVDALYRIEQQNDILEPWAGSMELGTRIKEHSSIRLVAQTAIRFPSGNELFWNNLGNPDLQPERSNQLSLSYAFEQSSETCNFQLKGTLYYKDVENWILWAPLESVVFRPYNLLRVRSKGLEVVTKFQKRWTSHHHTGVQFNYGYQHIRNISGSSSPLALQDGPLIYQPEHLYNFWIHHQIGAFGLRYLHDYRSSIFTQADLQEAFPALHLSHISLDYSFELGHHTLATYLTLRNIGNQDYFFQPQLPGPGRQIQWGLHLKL